MYIIRLLIIYSHEHTNDAGHHRCPHQNTLICGQMCVYVCVGVLRILQTKPPQHRRRWLRPSTRKNKTCIIAHAAWLCFVFILGSLSRIPPNRFALVCHIYSQVCCMQQKRASFRRTKQTTCCMLNKTHYTHIYSNAHLLYADCAMAQERKNMVVYLLPLYNPIVIQFNPARHTRIKNATLKRAIHILYTGDDLVQCSTTAYILVCSRPRARCREDIIY